MQEDDVIYRQAAIDAVCKDCEYYYNENVIQDIKDLPSAQPEPHYDEWCTDCKEYDHERHCCPRWNRVIRETLKDAQPEIIRCKDCKWKQGSECVRFADVRPWPDDFCSRAERRTE